MSRSIGPSPAPLHTNIRQVIGRVDGDDIRDSLLPLVELVVPRLTQRFEERLQELEELLGVVGSEPSRRVRDFV